MSEKSRKKILEEGARLVRKNGFTSTGLNSILKAAEVPKGSFYYYFSSKNQFGLELIDYLGAQVGSAFGGYLCCEYEESPILRLKQFFEYFKEEFSSEEFPLGCPVGNLTQELAAVSPEFRNRLKPVFTEMYSAVACCLTRAQTRGEITLPISPEETARFIVNSWQGALTAYKISENTEPLDFFEKFIFRHLLKIQEVEK